jgi:hypothetical protein
LRLNSRRPSDRTAETAVAGVHWRLGRKRFGREQPADVRPLEQILADRKQKKAERKAQKREEKARQQASGDSSPAADSTLGTPRD